MKSILFVCTGNVFRSMTAEYALRRELGESSPFKVSSAGIDGGPHKIWPEVRKYLASVGLDVSGHEPRRLSAELLNTSDIVIAMAENHRQFIEENWGLKVPLFNEFCHGSCTPVQDIDEAVDNWQTENEKCVEFAAWTIRYIIDSMPKFTAMLRRGSSQ